MKVQLNTDNRIQGNEAMEDSVNKIVSQHLERFFPHLSRIEVHLADTNGGKHGSHDKQCSIEARMNNSDPIGVSHDDETVEKAVHGACTKLHSRLETKIEQKRNH